MHIRDTIPSLAIFPSPNGKLPLRRAFGNRSGVVAAVADSVVFETEVVDINMPVDEVRSVEIWGDPCDIFNTVIKTTAAAMIRTIKIPAMIFYGTLPGPLDGRGEGAIGVITGSCTTDSESWWDGAGISGSTGVPQLSQNFIPSDNVSPHAVQNFCRKHHTLLKS